MDEVARLRRALAARPAARLATLPTPLEPGPVLPGGARLWVKRDDLTGLGMGGNKARKLERLCGQALADGADTLVTVGAGQSNHCRMTAAAGAVLGLPVHLVLGGTQPPRPEGNQLLAGLFGARLHFAGTDSWAELEQVKDALAEGLRQQGSRPAALPIGGSTATGAAGFAAAYLELADQAAAEGIEPVAVVHASSSGGTHAGLLAGRACWLASGRSGPEVVGVAVADGVTAPAPAVELAGRCLRQLGLNSVAVPEAVVVSDWLGAGYGQPTAEADAAITWAARHGGWVLDRTYTGKGFAGLLGLDAAGWFPPGSAVVFWHTGGQPAVFASGGSPPV